MMTKDNEILVIGNWRTLDKLILALEFLLTHLVINIFEFHPKDRIAFGNNRGKLEFRVS